MGPSAIANAARSLVTLIIASAALVSCRLTGEHTFLRSVSPDGRFELVIAEWRHGSAASMRVKLNNRQQGRSTVVYAESADRILAFGEVVWSGPKAHVFLCDAISSQPRIRMLIDADQRRVLPAPTTADDIRDALRRRYGTQSDMPDREDGTDLLAWACNDPRASEAFAGNLQDSLLPALP